MSIWAARRWALRSSEDGHVFLTGHWVPDDGRRIDAHAVDEKIRWALGFYQVDGFFADVREWESFTKVAWPDVCRDSLLVWAVPGGKQPEPVAWDMRTRLFDFTQACELTEREIIEHGFTHDGSAVLSNHVKNCHRYENRYGISVKKETPNSPRKIDAAVCMIGARMVRRLVLEKTPATVYDGSYAGF